MATWWDLAYLIYTPWDVGEPPDELVELVESGTLKPCRILDIGCGTGTSVVYLAAKGFEAVGIDVSRIAISKAKKKARKNEVECSFHVIDFLNTEKLITKLPEPFNAVIDIGCLHSIPKDERKRYLTSLKSVTRFGSTFLLWAFLPASGRHQLRGPPGVSEIDVKRLFSKDFQIAARKRLDSDFRVMIFYSMKRASALEKRAKLSPENYRKR